MPELSDAELKRARRASPKRVAAFRRAIEKKLGVSRPPRMGRPPKHPEEKYVPISWRTPRDVKEWLIAESHHAGIDKYQTFLNLLLTGLTRFEAVREKNGVTLRLPNSEHSIVIASGHPVPRGSRRKRG